MRAQGPPTARDLFVLKLEQLISELTDLDETSKEIHAVSRWCCFVRYVAPDFCFPFQPQLAAHIFPRVNTTRAVNYFLDHIQSVVGNIGSAIMSNVLVAIPRQSPPNCVEHPSMLETMFVLARQLEYDIRF